MDDEIERLKPHMMPADMQSWNIEDLQSYIEAMKAEIVKVEAVSYTHLTLPTILLV